MRDAMDFDDLLSRRQTLNHGEAWILHDALLKLWNTQAPTMKAERRTASDVLLFKTLEADLKSLRHWYNPIASGKKLRDAIDALTSTPAFPQIDLSDLVEPIDERRALVSPEGRVALWLIADALDKDPGASESALWFDTHTIGVAWSTLTSTYRAWNRQRLISVTKLLQEDTATLRPTAVGLLLVLLINRNTAPERHLPAPKDRRIAQDIGNALSSPVLAFANTFAGTTNAKASGIDLYRGWALGEISRRLGSGLHKDPEGIWVEQEPAERRLIEALASRPANQTQNLGAALNATLKAYQDVRPTLTSLGIAHERPSGTARLFAQVSRAVGSKFG